MSTINGALFVYLWIFRKRNEILREGIDMMNGSIHSSVKYRIKDETRPCLSKFSRRMNVID